VGFGLLFLNEVLQGKGIRVNIEWYIWYPLLAIWSWGVGHNLGFSFLSCVVAIAPAFLILFGVVNII
jgi:hypothetical protein